MADNTLEIIIKANANQAVATLKQVDKSVAAIGKSGGPVDALKTKWADLNKTLASPAGQKMIIGTATAVIGALTGISAAAKKLADDYMNYAFEVEDFARVLGTSAEEASKFIQVADDVRLSTASMTAAFKFAIKQGFEPSIDSLKELSDQYLAIQSGADRSRFLLEKFGRAGLEMGKLLELGGAKIEAMGNSIEGTSRLMTEQGIQAAKNYYTAMDELGEVIEDLKNTIGAGLLPTFIELIKVTTNGITSTVMLIQALYDLEAAERDGIISANEYWNQLYLLTTNGYDAADAINYLADKGFYLDQAYSAAVVRQDQLRRGLQEMPTDTEVAEEALGELATAAMETGNALTQSLNRKYEIGINFRLPDIASQIANWVKSDKWTAAGGDAAQQFINEFSKELAGLDATVRAEALKQVAAIELAAKVEIGEINVADATKQLQELFGGKYGENKAMIEAAVELDANTSTDIKAALEAMDIILPVYSEPDQNSLSILKSDIESLKPFIMATVGWSWKNGPPPGTGGGGGGGTTGGGGGGPNQQMATGGSFIVPPGYRNDNYLVGVTSGERVSVATAAQQKMTPSTSITNNFTIMATEPINVPELARQINREQQRQNPK